MLGNDNFLAQREPQMKAPNAMLRPPSSRPPKRFTTLPENRFASRAVGRLARFMRRPGSTTGAFPLLFLHGPPGSGKSHLVHALVKSLIARRPDLTARLLAARDLAPLLVVQPAGGPQPNREFRDCDLLIVEDVQHLSAASGDALARLIDQRQARQAATVVTSVAGPALLTHLSRRLLSRLSGGLVVGIGPLSPASRLNLARALCEARRLAVTDDVLEWLARSPAGGARPMLGNLHRLERLSRTQPPPLSLANVTAELPPESTAPLMERLAERVSGHFGLTVKQLKGRDRRRCLLWPRQVAMYLARRLTEHSLPRIGAYFGGFDHSTVLYACGKVERAAKANISLANELTELMAMSS
jgi:chromosomal replication initiator protein